MNDQPVPGDLGVVPPADPDRACEHLGFAASVDVGRIRKTDGGPVAAFIAEVKVFCVQCRVPFEFPGVPLGLSYEHPTVSVDGQTMDVPIRPVGETGYDGAGLTGYGVTIHRDGV